jgi:hypothetical protein
MESPDSQTKSNPRPISLHQGYGDNLLNPLYLIALDKPSRNPCALSSAAWPTDRIKPSRSRWLRRRPLLRSMPLPRPGVRTHLLRRSQAQSRPSFRPHIMPVATKRARRGWRRSIAGNPAIARGWTATMTASPANPIAGNNPALSGEARLRCPCSHFVLSYTMRTMHSDSHEQLSIPSHAARPAGFYARLAHPPQA